MTRKKRKNPAQRRKTQGGIKAMASAIGLSDRRTKLLMSEGLDPKKRKRIKKQLRGMLCSIREAEEA